MADTPNEQITAEVVQARAALAGLAIDPDYVEDVVFLMENALAPLRTLDLRALRLVEPATSFRAAWSE